MTAPERPAPQEPTAQEHADTVREALNFGYGGDPNYRPFYEDGITALDALLAEVERLTAERDKFKHQRDKANRVLGKALHRAVNLRYEAEERAEAAERERDEARAEIIAATTWYADNFGGGEDDPDPADMTLGQMLLAIYDWGNVAWGNAGRESERADEAHSRLYAAVTRSEAAEALAERYRAVLKSDGHGNPSFHMSTCPGCAALLDEGGHS